MGEDDGDGIGIGSVVTGVVDVVIVVDVWAFAFDVLEVTVILLGVATLGLPRATTAAGTAVPGDVGLADTVGLPDGVCFGVVFVLFLPLGGVAGLLESSEVRDSLRGVGGTSTWRKYLSMLAVAQ